MFQEFFHGRDALLIWPLVGLVIFVASFLGVLAYVVFGLRDDRKRHHLAALPLDDGLADGDGRDKRTTR